LRGTGKQTRRRHRRSVANGPAAGAPRADQRPLIEVLGTRLAPSRTDAIDPTRTSRFRLSWDDGIITLNKPIVCDNKAVTDAVE